MDCKRIGLFIKKLREEKGWTQEVLADKVHCSRSAVGKWENFNNFPDPSTMEELCKVFNITHEELISGERNTKRNVFFELYVSNDNQYKKIKLLIKIIIIMAIIILLFGCYYFISQYRKIHAYTVSGYSDNFSVENGLFVLTNKKIYLNIGNLSSKSDLKTKKQTLYYKNGDSEKLLYEIDSDETILLIENKGYESFFVLDDLDTILKDTYLRVFYDDGYEEIKLSFVEDYVNDELFFINNEKSSGKKAMKKELDDDLIDKLKKKFEYIEEDNQYEYVIDNKNESIFLWYNPSTENIVLVKEYDNVQEKLIYDLGTKLFDYNNVIDDNTDKYFTFQTDTNECIDGDCISALEKFEYFHFTLNSVLK